MDASKGGFNAADTWKNNISGKGGLTKEGSGSLSLLGNNSYKGGTTVKAGTLAAENGNALGDGSLTLAGGNLTLSAKNVVVKGNYTQSGKGSLNLNSGDKVSVSGTAKLGGKLVVKDVKGLRNCLRSLKAA
ncbi:autotransporter-associated beta strand repeat-containing protein [Lentilactobacillus buchneri]|uniref:autotransporter-associated beta strand repeat-containing protein n=1 Tax=Lentilactobacillus buchneri TaxID=1581 RepID=UPI001CDCBAB6|nr:autotransporter-associated beta strand repeat-containing protein [Lentilactobacillus buchneri]